MRANALLRLYPPAWRERYQDEVEALLDQHAVTLVTILDLFWGALDARLDPAFTSERMFRPMSRLRTSMIVVFCAYAAFTLGFLAFQRLTFPYSSVNPYTYVEFAGYSPPHPEIGIAMNIIIIAWQVGLLALAVGGVPIALDILWQAWRRRNWRTLAFFATPLVLLAICATSIYLVDTHWLTYGSEENFAAYVASDAPVLAIEAILLFGSGIASVVVISYAVARSQVSLGALRFARWAALAMTLVIAVEIIAVIYWGVQVHTALPWIYNGVSSPGLAAPITVSAADLTVVVAWMLLTLAVAVAYTFRSFTTRGPEPGAGMAPAPQAA